MACGLHPDRADDRRGDRRRLVAHSCVPPGPEPRPSITALLGFLGFALGSSPSWTSISFEGLELPLIREMHGRQLEARGSDERANGDSATSARHGRIPAATPPPAHPVDPAPSGEDREAVPSSERELLAQRDRWELPPRALPNPELLALNALVTRPTTGNPPPATEGASPRGRAAVREPRGLSRELRQFAHVFGEESPHKERNERLA